MSGKKIRTALELQREECILTQPLSNCVVLKPQLTKKNSIYTRKRSLILWIQERQVHSKVPAIMM